MKESSSLDDLFEEFKEALLELDLTRLGTCTFKITPHNSWSATAEVFYEDIQFPHERILEGSIRVTPVGIHSFKISSKHDNLLIVSSINARKLNDFLMNCNNQTAADLEPYIELCKSGKQEKTTIDNITKLRQREKTLNFKEAKSVSIRNSNSEYIRMQNEKAMEIIELRKGTSSDIIPSLDEFVD